MSLSVESPLLIMNNRLMRKSKFLMVRTLAMQQAKNVTKSEQKAKRLMEEFQAAIHSGSTGGINVRI